MTRQDENSQAYRFGWDRLPSISSAEGEFFFLRVQLFRVGMTFRFLPGVVLAALEVTLSEFQLRGTPVLGQTSHDTPHEVSVSENVLQLSILFIFSHEMFSICSNIFINKYFCAK